MKKILLIHTGGTLGMTGGRPEPLRPDAFASSVHEFVPELRAIADLDVRVLFNVDSSDLQPGQIELLARCVHESYDGYDGFVVTHGTDTLAFTASALAFLLRGLDKPIVLTGSQRPMEEIRSDAKPNLVAACVLAALPEPIPEVTVFFGTELFRGCRVRKLHTAHFGAFSSPNCPALARLGVAVERGAHVRARGTGIAAPTRLCTDLFAFRLFPGLDPEIPSRLLDGGVKGFVVEAFGLGNVPVQERSFLRFLEAAARREVPVVLATQCLHGAVDPTLYEGGRRALEAGVIPGGDITPEAALMKLAVLAGSGATAARVREAFEEDWAGERSRTPA